MYPISEFSGAYRITEQMIVIFPVDNIETFLIFSEQISKNNMWVNK